jgi:hypothetical protein
VSAERRLLSTVIPVLARGPAPTLALALALAGALAPRPALAYRTAADFPEFAGTDRVRWATPVIPYERSTRTPSTLSSTAVADTVLRAFSTWSAPSCSAVLFDNSGVTAAPATPEDGRNTIDWRSADWEGLGAPPEAAGVTDVQYEKGADGVWRIVEADLYLNVQHHTFSIGGQGPEDARDLLGRPHVGTGSPL